MDLHVPPVVQHIVAFVQLRRIVGDAVTGVGRHTISMLERLKLDPVISLEMVAASDDVRTCSGQLPKSLESIPLQHLPIPRRPLEWLWKATSLPHIDRWVKGADWIYCPAEAFVPTRNARLAVTIHDLHALEANLPWSKTFAHRQFAAAWRIMLKKVVKHAHVILTVSEFTKKRLGHFFEVNPAKIVVVGNGVDLLRFQSAPKPSRSPYIFVVGGLTARKGGRFVLETARLLAAECPEVKLIVSGRSDRNLLRQAMDLPNLEILGYVADAELPRLYRDASALYFPSVYEGYGIPVAEALACGLPVVCSDHPALVEAGRGAAICIPFDNTPAAAQTLTRIIKDNTFATELRQRALNLRDQLSWDNCVNRLKEAFRNC